MMKNTQSEKKFIKAMKLLSETCNVDEDTLKVLTIKYAYKTIGTCCTNEYYAALSDIRLKLIN